MSETGLIPIPGSAICVINAGLHDMLIKKVTDAAYINNIRWYIRTMQSSGVCTHVVWLQTTAVLQHRYPYPSLSNSRIREWNRLVSGIFQGSEFRDNVTIIDPFEESVNWPHDDKVHLNAKWYTSLAMTLKDVYKNAS